MGMKWFILFFPACSTASTWGNTHCGTKTRKSSVIDSRVMARRTQGRRKTLEYTFYWLKSSAIFHRLQSFCTRFPTADKRRPELPPTKERQGTSHLFWSRGKWFTVECFQLADPFQNPARILGVGQCAPNAQGTFMTRARLRDTRECSP